MSSVPLANLLHCCSSPFCSLLLPQELIFSCWSYLHCRCSVISLLLQFSSLAKFPPLPQQWCPTGAQFLWLIFYTATAALSPLSQEFSFSRKMFSTPAAVMFHQAPARATELSWATESVATFKKPWRIIFDSTWSSNTNTFPFLFYSIFKKNCVKLNRGVVALTFVVLLLV